MENENNALETIIEYYILKHPNSSHTEVADLILDNEDVNISHRTLRKKVSEFRQNPDTRPPRELFDKMITENAKLLAVKQKQADDLRIIRKTTREGHRIHNAVLEYNKALVEILENEGLPFKAIPHDIGIEQGQLIVHLSDLHLNELIDIETNKYDFEIASKRLKKFASHINKLCKVYSAKTVVLCMGGDMLNSDRRLDELLSMSTNRAKATQLAIRLLRDFILDIVQGSANVKVVGVTGNESRAKQELGWSDITATDNYDFTIYDSLKLLFDRESVVEFMGFAANEIVFEVGGKTFLLIHGHSIKGNVQKSVQEVIGKYSNRGVKVDFVIFGHIHSAYLADYFARNSSLCGSNAYSEQGLNFVSKASQNVHIIVNNDIHSMKVDLQDISDVHGYDIEKDVDAYNAKSVSKLHQGKTIFKIVI